MKQIIAILAIIALMVPASAEIVLTKDTILDPSQSLASFVFGYLHVTSVPVVVESTYIQVDGVKFEVMPSDPTTVIITKWAPSNLRDPSKISFEFVIYTQESTTFDMTIDGVVPNTTYAIYKDGKLYKTITTQDTKITFKDSFEGSTVYAISKYAEGVPETVPTPEVTPPPELAPTKQVSPFDPVANMFKGLFGSVAGLIGHMVYGYGQAGQAFEVDGQNMLVAIGILLLLVMVVVYVRGRR